jgi:hypothetical protein
MIPQKKVLYIWLSRNRSSKVIDKVLKLNGMLQNVPYCHVNIVIDYNTNNIQDRITFKINNFFST